MSLIILETLNYKYVRRFVCKYSSFSLIFCSVFEPVTLIFRSISGIKKLSLII